LAAVKPLRIVLVLVAAALAAFAVAILLSALHLHPANATDKAARLQALAAVGALLASIVLIVVTFAYVVLTGDMVREARQARLDAVRPALGIRIDSVGPVNSLVAVASVGQGAAIDVDITITYHPDKPGGHTHSVRWRTPLMAPGQFAQFMPKDQNGVVQLNTQTLVGMFSKVTVTGTIKDAGGTTHPVDLTLDDVPGWQQLLASSSQRYLEPAADRIASTLEKIEQKLP
jgi:hypothetical protein